MIADRLTFYELAAGAFRDCSTNVLYAYNSAQLRILNGLGSVPLLASSWWN